MPVLGGIMMIVVVSPVGGIALAAIGGVIGGICDLIAVFSGPRNTTLPDLNADQSPDPNCGAAATSSAASPRI
jgi:hypothetical protein